MRETELFPPLKEYFNKLGYKVYTEVPCYGRCIDIVAVCDKEIISIEMKLCLNYKVFDQARSNKCMCNKSYIAIPTKPRNKHIKEWCQKLGIGILRVKDGEIHRIVEGKINFDIFKKMDFTGWKEGEIAGIANQKGVSEAFCVLDRIMRYVKEHPKADWQEIHDNIVHHYASKASLRGTMQNWKGFYLDSYKQELKDNNRGGTDENDK